MTTLDTTHEIDRPASPLLTYPQPQSWGDRTEATFFPRLHAFDMNDTNDTNGADESGNGSLPPIIEAWTSEML